MGMFNRPGNMGGDWETVGGGAWHAGQRVDPGGWTYSTNYSGKIPEGARTFDPNAARTSLPPQNPGGYPGQWQGNQGGGQQGGYLGQWGGGGGGQQFGLGGGGGPQQRGGYDPNMGGINQSGPQQGDNQAMRWAQQNDPQLYAQYQRDKFSREQEQNRPQFGWANESNARPGGDGQIAGLMQQMYNQGSGQGGGSQGYGGWGGLQTNQRWR